MAAEITFYLRFCCLHWQLELFQLLKKGLGELQPARYNLYRYLWSEHPHEDKCIYTLWLCDADVSSCRCPVGRQSEAMKGGWWSGWGWGEVGEAAGFGTPLGGSVISLTGRRNETREEKAWWWRCCCCDGEITAGLCKCQKVMKNASSGQETRCFSGVSALLAGSEEPN